MICQGVPSKSMHLMSSCSLVPWASMISSDAVKIGQVPLELKQLTSVLGVEAGNG